MINLVAPPDAKMMAFYKSITRWRGEKYLTWYEPTGYQPVNTRQKFQTATAIQQFKTHYEFLCDSQPAALFLAKPCPTQNTPAVIYVLHGYKAPADFKGQVFVYHVEDLHLVSPMQALFYQPLPDLPTPSLRRAFAVWYATTPVLSSQVLLSLTSFVKHNPEITLYFYTNVLFPNVPAPIIQVQYVPSDIAFAQGNVAHFADYVKTKLMKQFGGVCYDAGDTVTLRSFLPLYDSPDLLWSTCSLNDDQFTSGLIVYSQPNHPLFDHVLSSFHADYKPNNYAYNMEIATRSVIRTLPNQRFMSREEWFPPSPIRPGPLAYQQHFHGHWKRFMPK